MLASGKSSFSRVFKKVMGLAPSHFVAHSRETE